MKQTILVVALLASSASFAAKLETCVNDVIKSCGTMSAISGLASVSSNKCSVVQSGTREDGTRYAEKVIFKDSNTLYSIQLNTKLGSSFCAVTRADIYGQFVEQKQFEGRLFSVTADGRVVVIGRDNKAVYLINSKNKPYSSVVDIKVDTDGVLLTFENHQTYFVTADDVTKKLNHPSAQIN